MPESQRALYQSTLRGIELIAAAIRKAKQSGIDGLALWLVALNGIDVIASGIRAALDEDTAARSATQTTTQNQ